MYSIVSRITFWAKTAASQSPTVDQLEQPLLERDQVGVGPTLDLGFGVVDAELLQPMQEHLEMTSLVDHLGGQEDLGVAGSARTSIIPLAPSSAAVSPTQ